MSRLRTATLVEADALQAIAPDWWRLWRHCPNATPFQCPAWLLPWWTNMHPGLLRVAVAWADGTLVAVAPLYLEDGPHGRRLLPLGMSISDYLDALIDPAWTETAGAALLVELQRDGGWERIDWEELPPDASALRLLPPPGWEDEVAAQSACPVLALPSSIEGLAGPVPSLKLRKLRMARRRADRRSAMVETATADTASDWLDHLFRLHGERWQAKGEAGVLANSTVQAFHRQAVPGLIGAGVVHLVGLVIEGRVAGVYYGFLDGTRAYAYLGGFDPAFAFESPGTILLGQAIEMAVEAGAQEFHFLRGQEPYKYEWGARDRPNSRRLMRPPR